MSWMPFTIRIFVGIGFLMNPGVQVTWLQALLNQTQVAR